LFFGSVTRSGRAVTASFDPVSWAELLDTCESFGFFFFRGAGSAVWVSVSPESPALASVSLWSDGDEFVDDDDAAPEPVAGSAEATP
jgi:hypothetical protein